CPQSNMKLSSGTAPVREMLAEGMRLGLGTDGAASNNDLDMFEEMLTAAFLAKHTSGDPTVAPAAAVLDMATLGGARPLGMEARKDFALGAASDREPQPAQQAAGHAAHERRRGLASRRGPASDRGDAAPEPRDQPRRRARGRGAGGRGQRRFPRRRHQRQIGG